MSEKITLSGVPETMLQTVYARAKETKTRGAITDNKAVEIIDRLDYDFSMADKDAAMHSGVIARTIVLDKLVKTYLAGHGGAVVENMACGLDTRCYRMSGYSPPDGRQPRRQTVSAAYKENAGALLLRIRQHGGPKTGGAVSRCARRLRRLQPQRAGDGICFAHGRDHNHMQYQIRDPQGFAAMLERIIEQNELPPLPFLRK